MSTTHPAPLSHIPAKQSYHDPYRYELREVLPGKFLIWDIIEDRYPLEPERPLDAWIFWRIFREDSGISAQAIADEAWEAGFTGLHFSEEDEEPWSKEDMERHIEAYRSSLVASYQDELEKIAMKFSSDEERKPLIAALKSKYRKRLDREVKRLAAIPERSIRIRISSMRIARGAHMESNPAWGYRWVKSRIDDGKRLTMDQVSARESRSIVQQVISVSVLNRGHRRGYEINGRGDCEALFELIDPETGKARHEFAEQWREEAERKQDERINRMWGLDA